MTIDDIGCKLLNLIVSGKHKCNNNITSSDSISALLKNVWLFSETDRLTHGSSYSELYKFDVLVALLLKKNPQVGIEGQR